MDYGINPARQAAYGSPQQQRTTPQLAPQGGAGFNPYSAGDKHYGLGQRSAPNVGPASGQGQIGYQMRDAQAQNRKDALVRRIQSGEF